MEGVATFLANTWPILGALVLVGLITYGALTPYIRAERRRRENMENSND